MIHSISTMISTVTLVEYVLKFVHTIYSVDATLRIRSLHVWRMRTNVHVCAYTCVCAFVRAHVRVFVNPVDIWITTSPITCLGELDNPHFEGLLFVIRMPF